MSQLLLIGSWDDLARLGARFHAAGHAVTMITSLAEERSISRRQGFALAIAAVATVDELDAATRLVERAACPWLVLDGGLLTREAFDAGALSVLTRQAEPELVERAALNALQLSRSVEPPAAEHAAPRRNRYGRGQTIVCNDDEVLLVESGVVALTALQEDGSEVILGFLAAGDVGVTPAHELGSAVWIAWDLVLARSLRWSEAVKLPNLAEGLRDQLCRAHAWSAARARALHLDRLREVLALLARQFGSANGHGVRIDLRLTHEQLARTIGANRSTVTRLLAQLQRSGELRSVNGPQGPAWLVAGEP